MANQTAKLDWRDGRVPISAQFDDPYYSLENGLAETEHVFIDGNDLQSRLDTPLHIGELGFGTGLNFLVTWAMWAKHGAKAPLHFTSFEAYPMALPDMQAALLHFPELADYSDVLLKEWAPGVGPTKLTNGPVLHVIVGDARDNLPSWTSKADAWFLDGFSPAKNPELWDPALLCAVGAHTSATGTAATYSAAGHVRRSLTEAGFKVARVPGYGRKRHMTKAWKSDAE